MRPFVLRGGSLLICRIRSCYIFTFDSLGGNHNPVVKRLKDYLVKEALDKKKIEVTITPANCVAKTAIVRTALSAGRGSL